MSTRELRRAEVLGRVKGQTLRLVDAAKMLEVSYRQAKRLWQRYREEGGKGLQHRSAGRSSNRAKPEKFRRKVLQLIREKYSGTEQQRFGPTLAAEHLADEDGLEVGEETLRRWMLAEGLWSRMRRRKAQEASKAIGHFNISDLVLLKAVFDAARELHVPVLVGLSEGERAFVGTHQIAAFVRSLREEFDFPIFINADHTHSLEKAVKATEAGFDSVVFDLSALPFEENIRQTKQAVEALKSINPGVLVEGEIGDIGSGSEIHESSPDLFKGLSTPAEAKQFVEATGVDILAPAVGNMHGMLKSMVEGHTKKHLDIPRIQAIKGMAGKFLTLHGGSGTNDQDLRKAISAGINIVHINTELRVAWRQGLERSLAEHKTEVVPYKILPPAVASVKQVVASRLKLFNGAVEWAQGG